MKAQLEKRLSELKAEYEAGQKMLTNLETRQANLRETLLRISGAIQVLEEVLENNSGTDGSAVVHKKTKQKKTKSVELSSEKK